MVSCPLLFPPVNTGISAARRRHFPPAVGTASPPPDGGIFPKHRGRFGQRTNFPSIFQLSMFAIDISYFPWYS